MLYWLRQLIGYLLLAALVLGLMGLAAVWFFFREGAPYPDRSGEPILPEGTIEAVVTTDLPVGNVAVSQTGRIFFTVHPHAFHNGPSLYEWVDGAAVPFPAADRQAQLFDTPLGLEIDAADRLWVVDPARHGFGQPRLLQFDLATGETLFSYDIPRTVAPRGSFLQDLAVGPDGEWVYIADAGILNRHPAIVVVETGVKRAHRVLERHATVIAQDYLIRNQIRPMSWFSGLVSKKAGVDGIALSEDGEWLYFAAMNHDTAHRVPPAALRNPNVNVISISVRIESVTPKPLSDGIALDGQGNLYITDVEHQAIHRFNPKLGLETLVKDSRIRWADSLAFGPDGALYIADSAVPELLLTGQTAERAAAPFTIWKVTPPRTPEVEQLPGGNRSEAEPEPATAPVSGPEPAAEVPAPAPVEVETKPATLPMSVEGGAGSSGN